MADLLRVADSRMYRMKARQKSTWRRSTSAVFHDFARREVFSSARA